jgi:hypothetical protein
VRCNFAFYHCYSIIRVVCTRERPQTHPQDRISPTHGKMDMRLWLEEQKDKVSKARRHSDRGIHEAHDPFGIRV